MDCKVLSIAVVVSAILLTACSRVHRGDGQAEMTIDLDVDALLSEEVSIYDMFSDVEVVRLDCVCPISNHVHLGLSNIASDGEKIYLLDWKDGSIHVHAMDGSLVLHADKKGRGPGEYSMADQINYNDELDVVEVLNPMSKILRYTPDSLKFISGVDFFDNDVRAIHNFYQCGDDYILYSLSAEDKLWDLNFETSGTESYGYRPPQYLFRYISAQSPFFEMDGRPYYYRTYDGLIYGFDKRRHRLFPYMAWNLGRYQSVLDEIPDDKTVREYHDFILDYSKRRLSPFIDIKAYGSRIFASVIHNGEIHTLCCDLATGGSLLFEKTVEGMRFLPELFLDGVMYKFVDYVSLPEYVNRDILDPSSRAAYDKVLAEEGAAIVRYSLK